MRLAALALIASAASRLDAQSAGCLPVDDHARSLRDYAVSLVSDKDSVHVETRKRYFLAVVDTSEVVVESDAETCATAARRFAQETDPTGNPNRKVYVVRVGEQFIVTDPKAMMGEFQIHIVFDKNFKRLASFAG